MGDSSDSNQSDESIEAAERFDDQQTGKFGGGVTNVSDPGDSGGFAGNTPQQRAITERQYNFKLKNKVREKARMGNIPGVSERLNPTTHRHTKEFARQQNEIDERGYDPTQEQINVGPGDIFGLTRSNSCKFKAGWQTII